MKKHPIVIITDEFDPHADAVLLQLRAMGHEPARFHTADIPQRASLSLALDGTGWQGLLNTPRRTIPLEEVRSIWWRRPANIQLPQELGLIESSFARDETMQALRGAWEMLETTCYWVSFPSRIRKAGYKIGQLQRAAALGLNVPRTVVTNDPERVREFYETCDHSMIYKTLFSPHPAHSLALQSAGGKIDKIAAPEFSGHGLIFTKLIRDEDLALLDTIRLAPGLFQEYVPKRVELRITVIGDDVFAAEMHSQIHPETRHDWRHYEVDVPTYEHKLPDEIADKCVALTRAYGLNFSTSDFIVTPEGRYIFLEMNPNGQFIWVENLVPTLRMTEALAACLIRGANASCSS